MARVAFTDEFLTKVQPPARGQIDLWDDTFPGFGLRISQGGTRAWVVMVRRDRRKVRVTLGTHPDMPLEMARGRARALLDESRRVVSTNRRGRASRSPLAGGVSASWRPGTESQNDPASAGMLPVSSVEFKRTAARLMQLMGELLRTDMAPVDREALDQVINAGARLVPPGQRAHATAASPIMAAMGAPAPNPPISNAAEDNIAGLRKPRLLLVEDTELNRLVTLAMLGTGRFDIDCVSSGEAAVQSVQDVHYDVVLMDISMPEMDGIAATRAIRALPAPACDVPVLAMTAHAMVGDRERCLAAGMDDYLPKPVSRGDLLDKVEHFARRGRGGAASLIVSDEPALNADALDQLRRDMQPEALRQLLDATLPEVQTRVSAARAANEARDLDALGRSAHSLKGIATTIGARRLQAAATALESAARTGQDVEISRLLESLESLSERTMRAIAAERARL